MKTADFKENKMIHIFVVITLLAVSVARLPLRPALAAPDATFIVDSTADVDDAMPGDGHCDDGSGACTLRAAISEANALAGADTISLPAGTYTLTITGNSEQNNATGDLDVTSEVTLNGAGAGTTIISVGSGGERAFHVVGESDVLTLDGVTIRDGTVNGGGVYNSGTLTVTHSIISNNSGGTYGGGLYNNGGTMVVQHSTIADNATSVSGSTEDGGGVYDNGGTLIIEDSTLSGNTADDYGGGICSNGGNVTLRRSTLVDNSAKGGGGGIETYQARLSLADCTLSGNRATSGNGGGVYSSSSSTTLAHCTLTNNAATGRGGGVYQYRGTVNLKNSIVVGNNGSPDTNDDCYSVSSQGYNLVGVGTGCPSDGAGDQTTTDPKLGPLQDHGGPTETYALLPGSPALDVIPNGTSGCGTTYTSDQRGVARPQVMWCDAGAYEFDDYKYWDGEGPDNNTSTAANWSGDSLPTADDVVMFDHHSSKDAVLDAGLTVFDLVIDSGYTGTITQGNRTLTVSKSWVQDGGTFTGGSGALDVGLNFELSGGTFSAPTGNLTLSGDFDQSGGTFAHSDGTVVFDGSGLQAFSGAAVFFNLVVNSGSTLQLAADSDLGYAATFTLDGSLDTTTHIPNTLRLAGNGAQTLPPGATDLHSLVIDSGATLSAPASLAIAGDWTDNGAFTHNNGLIIFDGQGAQFLTGSTAFYDLIVGSSTVLVDQSAGAAAFSVSGTLANDGTLQKTQDVNGAADVTFFDTGGYGGLTLDANGLDLGSTESRIRGNTGFCTTVADETVRRCFEISPANTSGVDATVTFYFDAADIPAGQSCSTLDAYHWNGSGWDLLARDSSYGTDGHACGTEPYSLRVAGVSDFSPFVLKDGAPTGEPLYLVVNSTADVIADEGRCTLREAVTAANTDTASGTTPGECAAGNGADVIVLPTGTYTLTITGNSEQNNATGDLDVTNDSEITILGAGADTTIIQVGTGGERAFHVFGGGDVLTLDSVTLRGGRVNGGGVYNSGTLTVTHSIITNNSGAQFGGGLYNNGGAMAIQYSTIADNATAVSGGTDRGGGVYNDYGTLTIKDSTLSNNTADDGGGGIFSDRGTVNVFRSSLVDNAAAGGGGMSTYDTTVNLTHCTLSGNSATFDGGGMHADGSPTTLAHCTITNNTAGRDGGGIYRDQRTVSLENSIIAGNSSISDTTGDCGASSYGDTVSQGYNLVGDGTGCPSDGIGDRTTTDPKLGPLQDNGGPTETYALLYGSPALDAIPAGVNGCGTIYTTDQRGEPRPVGGSCDVGAYENDGTWPVIWDGGGADNNWSTPENWPEDTLPATYETAVFDNTSDKPAHVDTDVTIAGMRLDPGYDGTLTQGDARLVVNGDWQQSGGAYSGGSGTLDINGRFDLSGGTFTAPYGVLAVSGGFAHTGGTFDPHGGSVVLDNTGDRTLATAAAFQDLYLNDGLAGYWKLDGGSTAADSSGYDEYGMLYGSSSWSPIVPAAMDFHDPYSLRLHRSNGEYVDIQDTPAIDDLQELTLSAWVRLNFALSNASMRFISLGNEKAVLRYENASGTGKLQFYTTIDGSIQNFEVDHTWVADTWYHVAGTYDGTTMRLYLDGVEQPGAVSVSGSVATGDGVQLSWSGSDAALDGWLDDVRVYSRALSTAEIQALAGGGHPQTSAALTTPATALHVAGDLTLDSGTLAQPQAEGYWKLDEGSGTTAADTAANGYDGALTRSPTWSANTPGLRFGDPYSLRFDRADADYVDIQDTPAIDDLQQLCLSTWVDLTSTPGGSGLTYMRFLQLGNGKAVLRYGDDNGTGKLQFYMTIGGSIHSIAVDLAWETGRWYHVAGTYDGSEMRLYLNGVLQGSPLAVPGTVGAGGGVWLSHSGGDEALDGLLDDVRVYGRALSAAEVQALADGYDLRPHDIVVGDDISYNGGVFESGGGTVTFDGSTTQTVDTAGLTFHNLTVISGTVLLDVNPAGLSVGNHLTNNGTLQRSQSVNGATDVTFFDTGGYGGLTLNANGSDLGSTTVSIGSDEEICTTNAWETVERCFDIAPANTTGRNATLTFYFAAGDVPAGQSCSALDAYHWSGSSWEALTTDAQSCDSEPYSLRVTGVSDFSPFVLKEGSPDDTPTAATLASFMATAAGGGVLLEWETAGEVDLLGFDVYRAKAPDGLPTHLNGALIPAQAPGSPVGTAYAWQDQNVEPGVTYTYWLEDVDVYGVATRHGPVSVQMPPPVGQYRIYLPLMSR